MIERDETGWKSKWHAEWKRRREEEGKTRIREKESGWRGCLLKRRIKRDIKEEESQKASR